MSALEDAVNALNEAINTANERVQATSDVQTAVAAEREKYDALVAAEEAEDVTQNQELQDARAQTDQALSQLSSVAESIRAAADRVNQLGQVAAEQPAETSTADATASTSDAGGDTTAEVSPTTDTTPSENPTDAAPADTPTAGDVIRADEEAQQADPTSTTNMRPDV